MNIIQDEIEANKIQLNNINRDIEENEITLIKLNTQKNKYLIQIGEYNTKIIDVIEKAKLNPEQLFDIVHSIHRKRAISDNLLYVCNNNIKQLKEKTQHKEEFITYFENLISKLETYCDKNE